MHPNYRRRPGIPEPPILRTKGKLPEDPRWSPGLAGFLSLLCPGLGQAYKGQLATGLLWFVFTFLGYLIFILPGMLLHACCILGAVTSPAEE